jgi:hypothetical protein
MSKYFYVRVSAAEYKRYLIVGDDGVRVTGMNDDQDVKIFSHALPFLIMDPDAYLKALYKKILEGYLAGLNNVGMAKTPDLKLLLDGHQKIGEKIKGYIALSVQIDKDSKPRHFYTREGNSLSRFIYSHEKDGHVYGEACKILKKNVLCYDHGLEKLRNEQLKKIQEGLSKIFTDRDVTKSWSSSFDDFYPASKEFLEGLDHEVIDDVLFYKSIVKAIKELEDER